MRGSGQAQTRLNHYPGACVSYNEAKCDMFLLYPYLSWASPLEYVFLILFSSKSILYGDATKITGVEQF